MKRNIWPTFSALLETHYLLRETNSTQGINNQRVLILILGENEYETVVSRLKVYPTVLVLVHCIPQLACIGNLQPS